jgi:hypothetical protein
MNLPKSIIIKGEKWKIQYIYKLKDSAGNELDGLTEFPNREIKLNCDQDPRSFLNTFLHEYFHACVMESGGIDNSITNDQEHLVISAIANAMDKNPKFWRSLFDLFSGKY